MKFPCDVIIHCEPNKKGTVITMTGWNELIRCKDCKYFTRDSITGVTIPGTEYCIFTMNNRIEENDYCSRAERKEENESL